MREFYIGYLPEAPPGIATRIRWTVIAVLAATIASALLFVSVQRTFGPSAFDFGKSRTFRGTIETRPYPALVVPRPGNPGNEAVYSRYLLVGGGKHGAEEQVANYDGKSVRLEGTLIYRGEQTMLELVRGSISLTGVAPGLTQRREDLGEFELVGEIVDSKCNFGVMNPGSGKVHRDCAVRCLSGGIPPAFAVADFGGGPSVFLLTDANGTAIPKELFIDKVAQPVRIKGRAEKAGDSLFFEITPTAITTLP
jgi:hypothetical protein